MHANPLIFSFVIVIENNYIELKVFVSIIGFIDFVAFEVYNTVIAVAVYSTAWNST